MYSLHEADAWDVLPALPAESVDAVVTDPPYALGPQGFMGMSWDRVDTPFRADFWREVMRVLKPGGHALVFGGSRTFHRMAVALEDAGFEYRDTVTWLFGSGFPKNHDVSKAIDKAAGAEREVVGPSPNCRQPAENNGSVVYGGGAGIDATGRDKNITLPATESAHQGEGWGTALKPAAEYIALVRKPLSERNVAANVLAHGTGAINVGGCRVPTQDSEPENYMRGERSIGMRRAADSSVSVSLPPITIQANAAGRFPANVVLTPENKQYRIKEDIKLEKLKKLADWLAENT